MNLATLLICLIPVFLIDYVVCSSEEKTTFKNVTVRCKRRGSAEWKFIIESKTLRENLPEGPCYDILFRRRDKIPVLYENSITDLEGLQVLHINEKEIEKIEPGAFRNLPDLKILFLGHNELMKIEDGIFDNLNLTQLNLRYNLIEFISPTAFDGLPKLEMLVLGNNKLKTFDRKLFENKPNLRLLDVRYNFIEELSDGSLENIRHFVDLSHNKIKRISHSMFGNSTTLGYLDLSHNEMTTWDENLFENVTVGEFNFRHNKVRCLEGDLDRLLAPRVIMMNDNPWNSECFGKIMDWCVNAMSHLRNRSIYKCNFAVL